MHVVYVVMGHVATESQEDLITNRERGRREAEVYTTQINMITNSKREESQRPSIQINMHITNEQDESHRSTLQINMITNINGKQEDIQWLNYTD